MGAAELLVHPGPDEVAQALAARLVRRIGELQQEQRIAQLALTGGRIALQAYRQLARDGASAPVDWARVELWWGDERFVPAEDGDRNAKQVLDVLSGALPFDPARIHPMPASDGPLDLDAAADAYDKALGSTTFDICLLGMGPDGHVASLFPDHPSSSAPGRVIGVRESPKPPPDRISLTLAVINSSTEVWFCVSGGDKAVAAADALSGHGSVPAARVTAKQRVVWFLDDAAAAQLVPTRPDDPT